MHGGADASGAGTGVDEQPLPCPSPASILLAPATLDSFMLCAGLSLVCEPPSPAFFSFFGAQQTAAFLFVLSLVKAANLSEVQVRKWRDDGEDGHMHLVEKDCPQCSALAWLRDGLLS